MNIKKIPLAQRLQRCADNCPAYPEYLSCVIRGFGEMPLAEYLSGVSPEKRRRVYTLIDAPGREVTYQWAALKIAGLPSRLALEAMRILAEPMVRYDEFIQREEARIRA